MGNGATTWQPDEKTGLRYATDVNKAAELLAEAEGLRSLDEAFKWAMRQIPRFHPDDVIIQDEYTHDVLFSAPDDSYLVFDTT